VSYIERNIYKQAQHNTTQQNKFNIIALVHISYEIQNIKTGLPIDSQNIY